MMCKWYSVDIDVKKFLIILRKGYYQFHFCIWGRIIIFHIYYGNEYVHVVLIISQGKRYHGHV